MRRGTPDDDLGLGPEHRREEHEPLDVIEMQVRQQDVQRPVGGWQRQPEAADSGPAVEHQDGPVRKRQLHA